MSNADHPERDYSKDNNYSTIWKAQEVSKLLCFHTDPGDTEEASYQEIGSGKLPNKFPL
jgi:hypothetical protein